MQTYRITPRVCRSTVAAAAARPSRAAISTFFPHFPSSPEIAPFFRLFDSISPLQQQQQQQLPGPFRYGIPHALLAPRFDVKEVTAAFELQGELPGIRQENVEIEFADANTLVIRGRTERERGRQSSNDAPAAAAVKGKEIESPATVVENDDVAAGTASAYQATVEDDYVDAGAESDVEGGAKSASGSATATTKPANEEVESTAAVEEGRDRARYWVSERATGEFERRFKFPGEVDQDAVKASLKNGILSIVVPKVVARKERRIVVE